MRGLWAYVAAFAFLSHPAMAHFASSQEGTLRFTEGRGYLVLSLPEAALRGATGSDPLSWQARTQSCIWMTGSDGRRVPLEGVLSSQAQAHHHDVMAPAVVTIMGVFRGVRGAADERLHVACYGEQPSGGYRLRASTADGQAWWVSLHPDTPSRWLAPPVSD